MNKLNGVFVNYEFKPEWLNDYDWEYLTVYDRSESMVDLDIIPSMAKVVKTSNKGNVDYDKLGFLVEHEAPARPGGVAPPRAGRRRARRGPRSARSARAARTRASP